MLTGRGDDLAEQADFFVDNDATARGPTVHLVEVILAEGARDSRIGRLFLATVVRRGSLQVNAALDLARIVDTT